MDVFALDGIEGSGFESMPGRHENMDIALSEGRATAWAALRSGAPAGLACAEWGSDDGVARLVTCYVRPLLRREGIGTALLTQLEHSVAGHGRRRIWCRYPDESPLTIPLESLLRKRGWDEPAHLVTHVRVLVSDLLRAPWRRFGDLPAGLRCTSWRTVTSSELAGLQDAERSAPWFPAQLAPWRAGIRSAAFDAEQSLVLRDEERIRGWLLVLRTAPQSACIVSAWVDPALQRSGPVPPFVPMCVRALEIGVQRGYRECTWSVYRDHERMATFNRRHLRPYATEITHERVSGRELATRDGQQRHERTSPSSNQASGPSAEAATRPPHARRSSPIATSTFTVPNVSAIE